MSNWISVKHRLPDFEQEVVLFPDFSGEPVVGAREESPDDGIDYEYLDNDGRNVSPTHWLPLPELPE